MSVSDGAWANCGPSVARSAVMSEEPAISVGKADRPTQQHRTIRKADTAFTAAALEVDMAI